MDAQQPAVVRLTPVYQAQGIQPQKRRAEGEREVEEDESKKKRQELEEINSYLQNANEVNVLNFSRLNL